MRKEKVYYIDFNNKPYSVKSGYIKISDKLLNDIIYNIDKYVYLEIRGKSVQVKLRNVYKLKELAEQGLKDYHIMRKYKDTHEHICKYCGKKIYKYEMVTVDHIKPKSLDGKTVESNLCIACKDCNEEKSNTYVKEYRKQINTRKKVESVKKCISKGKDKKIGRGIDLKRDNAEMVAKSDSRVWDVNFFNRISGSYSNKVDRLLMNLDKRYIKIS